MIQRHVLNAMPATFDFFNDYSNTWHWLMNLKTPQSLQRAEELAEANAIHERERHERRVGRGAGQVEGSRSST